MDKRRLKKYILFQALLDHQSNLYLQESNGTLPNDIAFTMDLMENDASDAQIRRYWALLQEMVDNAESKLN